MRKLSKSRKKVYNPEKYFRVKIKIKKKEIDREKNYRIEENFLKVEKNISKSRKKIRIEKTISESTKILLQESRKNL